MSINLGILVTDIGEFQSQIALWWVRQHALLHVNLIYIPVLIWSSCQAMHPGTRHLQNQMRYKHLFLYKTSAEPENSKTNRLPKQLTGVLQQITADIYDCCFTIHIQEILELSAVFTRAHNLLSAKWKSLCFTAMQIIIFRLW